MNITEYTAQNDKRNAESHPIEPAPYAEAYAPLVLKDSNTGALSCLKLDLHPQTTCEPVRLR